MSLAAPSSALPFFAGRDIDPADAPSGLPEFVLPVLPRSAVLLNLLLQDDAIDLGLASAVVGLDPGLTFAVLQLANPMQGDSGGPVWQLPQAIVTVGRGELQQLVNRVPRIGTLENPGGQKRSAQLVEHAALRAGVAYGLARELGRSNPRESFLGGLLLELPDLVSLNLPAGDACRARLLSVMCHCLPSTIVKAMMIGEDSDGCAPTAAIIFLASALLPASRLDLLPEAAALDLAALPFWQGWPELDLRQRCELVQSSAELARWTRASACRLDPWEFMARLERGRPWE
jgi:hypothetical protein